MIIHFAEILPHAIKGKIVRNPNYRGKSVGPFGWKSVDFYPAANKPGFHAAMLDSVRREGFRNPVVAYYFDEGLYLSFGGSRLHAAQQLDVKLPAIINDFQFSMAAGNPTLVTPENWHTFFKDRPNYHTFDEHGFDYHYHIEKNRRDHYDPAGLRWTEDLDDTKFLDEEFSWLKR